MNIGGFTAPKAAFLAVLIIAWSASFIEAQEYSINTQVDRTTVNFGESLNLTITLTQSLASTGGKGLGAPNINTIPGFDIISRQSAHNMTMVNGVGQIQVQSIFELVPQKAGDLVIPSLSVRGPDGKTSSTKEIPIKVKPPNEEPEQTKEKESTPPESDDTEQRSGMSLIKGAFIFFAVIALVIAAPIFLSWVLNRDTKKSRKWEEDTVEAKSSSQAAVVDREYSPASEKEEVEDAVIAPSLATEQKKIKIDFERDVEILKRMHPDVGVEFYRAYFDLLRRALLSRCPDIDPMMTPDEIVKRLTESSFPDVSVCARRLGNDWEAVAFAHTSPSRNFTAIHQDSQAVLKSLRNQEFKQ